MNKKIKLILIVLLMMIAIGVSYGYFSYYVLGNNGELISGDIYLDFEDSNTLNLTKFFPETPSEARARNDNIIIFNISGKNESTTDVFYKIMLSEGEEKEGYERFNAKDLRFDLVEINENNQQKTVVSDMSFARLNETVIYSTNVDAGTNSNITRTYKLRMWLDDRVLISDTDPRADYKATGEHAFKNHYASIKVSVKAESGTVKGFVRYNVNGEIQKQPIYEEEKTTIRQVSAPEGQINYEWSTNANGTGTKYKSNAEVEVNNDVTLYPIYINENVMNTFPTFVTSNKANIKEIYFNKSTTASLARYEEADASLKGDIATKGHVYTWLEQDLEDNLYRMYVESDSVTFLTFNSAMYNGLFKDYSKVTTIEFNNVDTSRIIRMGEHQGGMFSSCTKLVNIDLSNFDTRNVTNMQGMFSGCSSLINLDLSSFDTRNVTKFSVGNGNTDNVWYDGMFSGCNALQTIDLSSFDTRKVKYFDCMFFRCYALKEIDLSNFDTSSATHMGSMFYNCRSLTELDLSNFDTRNVISITTTYGGMFSGCSSLTSLDVSNFDTRNVTNMKSMFSGCSGLTTIDLSPLDTRNVTSMAGMFDGCSGLTTIDLSPLDTRNVTSMSSMFSGCSGLTTIDLSPLDTRNVTSMSSMFSGLSGLTSIDLSPLDTKNVTSMNGMFRYCSSLTELDLSNFDIRNVTNIQRMLSECTNLEKIYVSDLWVLNENLESTYMFYGCNKLVGQNGTKLSTTGNIRDATYAKVDEAGSPGYFWYKEA